MKQKTLGPVSDLERHLPDDWWKTLFNSVYLKTDGDVVENDLNTRSDVDLLLKYTGMDRSQTALDLCCGQGRHALELARRGFANVTGLDRSKYLIRLARKRAQREALSIRFTEGDARKVRIPLSSFDIVYMMGNSFGYFELEEDDHKVLKSVLNVLKSEGKIALDLMNGEWMRQNMEPRSWEWIDQNQFVCRERSLSKDKTRIVCREVIVHAERGVIADQFYAERLYSPPQITALLESLGFHDIHVDVSIIPNSTRDQDLGMMANRMFVTAIAPQKIEKRKEQKNVSVLVAMGDPSLPDTVKLQGKFSQEDFNTVNLLKEALHKIGHIQFEYADNHSLLYSKFSNLKYDLVFNLCDEGFFNDPKKELHVPAMLEVLGKDYTGANPDCLSLCYNKSLVRALALSLDIPVPEESLFEAADNAASIPSIFPALLKPNTGDSSVGITKDAVVKNAEQLMQYLDFLRQEFPGQSLLIQEFLSGREYSVGIIGNPGAFTILPILEVDYTKLPKDLPKILSYESKWQPDSPYWNDIEYTQADINDEKARLMIDYATKLFERTKCRDYARIDFREDANGVLKLLEVNPNPGWCWDGKLNLMAGFQGLSYTDLLSMILEAALSRKKEKV